MINDDRSGASIFRVPKMNIDEKNIRSFIKNFEIIKCIGLPTLQTVERFEIEGIVGVKTEDLNFQKECIYVTHNSLYSDSRRRLDSLNDYIVKSEVHQKSPEYEEFRYINKLSEITNFEQFVDTVKNNLSHAAERDVLIEFDSYFFGSKRNSDISCISYKIVDLDYIFTNTGKSREELLECNVCEFKRALRGFIRYFLIKDNRMKYEKYLDKNL